MITEKENRIRNLFFEEKGMKAYVGHINDGDNVVWKEEYVKWLESKLSQHDVIKNEVAVCDHDFISCGTKAVECTKCKQVFKTE